MAHSFNHKNAPQAERKLVRDTRRTRILAASAKRNPEPEGWGFVGTTFAAQSNGRFLPRRG